MPIDKSFSRPASEGSIEEAEDPLRRTGSTTKIVNTPEDARDFVIGILPENKEIFTSSSETVRLSGIGDVINTSGRFISLRKRLSVMDPVTQSMEMQKLGAAPDIVVGSVHAVTEAGQILVASATGSQLGPYSASAGKAIWIIGSQKVVPDMRTALRRIFLYSYPMEDVRARHASGRPSSVSKMLWIEIREGSRPDTLVFVREPVGF